MINRAQYRFVTLGYSRDLFVARGQTIAVVTQEVATVRKEVKLWVRPGWQLAVDAEDLQYLLAVFLDIAEREDEAIFDLVSSLNVGCLRTHDEGFCCSEDLSQFSLFYANS